MFTILTYCAGGQLRAESSSTRRRHSRPLQRRCGTRVCHRRQRQPTRLPAAQRHGYPPGQYLRVGKG